MRVNVGGVEVVGNKKLVIAVLIGFLSLALLVVSVLGIWEVCINTPYYEYGEGFYDFAENFQYGYQKQIGEFHSLIIRPHFLRNNGKITIKNMERFTVKTTSDGKLAKDNEPYFELIIYPSVIGEPRYEVFMKFIDWENSTDSEFNSISDTGRISFTKNRYGVYRVTQEFEGESYKVFCDNISTINKMLACAEETWSFDGINDIKDGFEAKHRMV